MALTKVTQSVSNAGAQQNIFYLNDKTITQNYTVDSNKNALSAGPLTVANGVIITVADGATWTIV